MKLTAGNNLGETHYLIKPKKEKPIHLDRVDFPVKVTAVIMENGDEREITYVIDIKKSGRLCMS